MLKKLLSAAAIWLLGAGFATAQESTVKIGETSYSDLAAAVAAVQDGETITITGEHVIKSRLNLNQNYTVAIKGEGAGAVIKTDASYKGTMLLLTGNSQNGIAAGATIENITFDGANVTYAENAKVIEITGASKGATFTDCKFINFNAGRVAFVQKASTFTNVSAENCNLSMGVLHNAGNNAVTVAGNMNLSVYIEKLEWPIKGGENLAGHIDLYLNQYLPDRVVVNNCTTKDVFSLANVPNGEIYNLEEKDGGLMLVSETPVVKNETQDKVYTSLAAAIAEAVKGDVLVVLADTYVTSRILNVVENLTIKGLTPDVQLIRTFTKNLMFGATKNLIFEDIVINCNNMANDGKYELAAENGSLTLKNVIIRNSKTNFGLIQGKVNQTLNIENVTQENCPSNVPGIALAGKMNISGNNNLSVNVTNTNAGVITATGELTNTEPIMLTLPATAQFGDVVVKNTLQYKNFELTNQGWYLNRDKANNNLILSNKKVTGIEDVAVDGEEAVAEYYTLSGVRVAAEGLAPGIYVKRQGGKAVKVYVK